MVTLICVAALVDGLAEVLDGGLIGEPKVALGVADAVQHGAGLVGAGARAELCSVFFGYVQPPGQVQLVCALVNWGVCRSMRVVCANNVGCVQKSDYIYVLNVDLFFVRVHSVLMVFATVFAYVCAFMNSGVCKCLRDVCVGEVGRVHNSCCRQ
nr:hypothetical protein Iba_chr08fCG0490 [Ipomoea batatas]